MSNAPEPPTPRRACISRKCGTCEACVAGTHPPEPTMPTRGRRSGKVKSGGSEKAERTSSKPLAGGRADELRAKAASGGLTSEEDSELDQLDDEALFIAGEDDRRSAPGPRAPGRNYPTGPNAPSGAVRPRNSEEAIDQALARVSAKAAEPPPPAPPPLPPEFKIGGRVRCLAGPPSDWTGGHRALEREGVVVGWRPPGVEVRYDRDREPTWLHPSRICPLDDVWGQPIEGFQHRYSWAQGDPPPIGLDEAAWRAEQASVRFVRDPNKAPYDGSLGGVR